MLILKIQSLYRKQVYSSQHHYTYKIVLSSHFSAVGPIGSLVKKTQKDLII